MTAPFRHRVASWWRRNIIDDAPPYTDDEYERWRHRSSGTESPDEPRAEAPVLPGRADWQASARTDHVCLLCGKPGGILCEEHR